jgi:hypothetical protein
MSKKPATIKGMIFRIALLAFGSMVCASLFGASGMFTREGVIITAAVLAPGVILGVIQQVRIRRAMKRR